MTDQPTPLSAEQALGVALSIPASHMLMEDCQNAAPAMLEHLRAMGYDLTPLATRASAGALDVETLGKAVHATYCVGQVRMHSDPLHSADRLVREYNRLAAARLPVAEE